MPASACSTCRPHASIRRPPSPRWRRWRRARPSATHRPAAASSSPRARSKPSPPSAWPGPRRAFSPARPTSACGSTRCSAALPSLLYIGKVDALQRIEASDGTLSIGAAASLEDGWRALVARWPTLTDVWLRFAGVPLRHAGTMGGNVANGSPIGDSAPVLMALDASLVLRCGERVRRLALADFYTGYMQNRLEPGEFVQAIEVPTGSDAHRSRLQDLEALRLRHLGPLRGPRPRARRHRHRSRRPASPSAAWPRR